MLRPLSRAASWRERRFSQAVVVAAGMGKRLAPFTDTMPKCFVPVGGRPMIQQTLSAFRSIGVTDVAIVRGYKGHYFEERKEEFEGVTFIDNPDFHSTEVFRSFAASRPFWEHGSGPLYISYSDIVFSEKVLRQLELAQGQMTLVTDTAFKAVYNGRIGHPLEQMEAVVVQNGAPLRIGKGAATTEAFGEFIGLLKVDEAGRTVLAEAIARAEAGVPTRRLDQWYLCNLFQLLIDEGIQMELMQIEGQWREVDTPHDLQRANAAIAYLNDPMGAQRRVAQLGHMLRSEANDLKRPLSLLASEVGVAPPDLKRLLEGEMEVDDAQRMMLAVSNTYPVPLDSLWVEADDTEQGVRFFSHEESVSTQRILSRADPQGGQSPYYIYRDAAMSKLAPFRPEYIAQLRDVEDADPHNPAVVYNNGHLAMQMTLFLGPVNFYYEVNGEKFCVEAEAGDSNFISPFVKHSFTRRDGPGEPAIVAVTYGGAVRSALVDLGRLSREALQDLSGDSRDASVRTALLRRLMRAALMTEQEVVASLTPSLGAARAAALLDGRVGANTLEPAETHRVAALLGVRPSDLLSEPLRADEDVVFLRRQRARSFPDDGSYQVTDLARTRHQPDLKSFLLGVSGERGAELSTHLHQFVFNPASSGPVTLAWAGQTRVLQPGASAYVAPMVPVRFGGSGEVLVARIPGRLTKETLDELSIAEPSAKWRIGHETMQWY